MDMTAGEDPKTPKKDKIEAVLKANTSYQNISDFERKMRTSKRSILFINWRFSLKGVQSIALNPPYLFWKRKSSDEMQTELSSMFQTLDRNVMFFFSLSFIPLWRSSSSTVAQPSEMPPSPLVWEQLTINDEHNDDDEDEDMKAAVAPTPHTHEHTPLDY